MKAPVTCPDCKSTWGYGPTCPGCGLQLEDLQAAEEFYDRNLGGGE
jgi:hypothetical protein